jgi:hypothetical protein
MMVVPISDVPSQTLQTVLGGQNCNISVYIKTGADLTDQTLQTPKQQTYMDLSYDSITVTTTALCLDQERILLDRQYLGFVGDFMFVDTQGSDDPVYTGFGTRWVLLYLESTDLP